MKLQEKIIYTAYSMIYFIIGYIFLSVTMLLIKSLFAVPLITPFMITFTCGTAMIFAQAISSLLKVILIFADSKLLFDIQGKLYKLNDFVKKLPIYLIKYI